MNYKISIKTVNKIFMIKNKPVRSPFQLVANEKELKIIFSAIRFYGLSEKEYTIEKIIQNTSKETDYSYLKSTIENKVKEEIKILNIDQPKEKIIHNPIKKPEEIKILNIDQPKEKIIYDNNSVRKQDEIIEPEILNDPKPTNTEIFNKPIENIEQNINKEEVAEVKIEELSIKANSLLEKFLHSNF